VARELELGSAANVNVMDNPKWRRLLGVRDKKGNTRMMTEYEAQQWARSQDNWWKTSHGRQADAEGAATMLRMFGVRPF
jgi:hypothetical protein